MHPLNTGNPVSLIQSPPKVQDSKYFISFNTNNAQTWGFFSFCIDIAPGATPMQVHKTFSQCASEQQLI